METIRKNRVSIYFPYGAHMIALLTDEQLEVFQNITKEVKLPGYKALLKMLKQNIEMKE